MTGTRFFRTARRRLRHLRDDQRGTATLEFVLVFPLFMMMFVSMFEIGLTTTRYMMMDRALDLTVRDLRLTAGKFASQDGIRTSVCDRAMIIKDCEATMLIELTPLNPATWEMPTTGTACVDRQEEITPVVTFSAGTENEIMLVRACVIVDPIFATSGFGAKLDRLPGGGFQMTASSAFVNEPY